MVARVLWVIAIWSLGSVMRCGCNNTHGLIGDFLSSDWLSLT